MLSMLKGLANVKLGFDAVSTENGNFLYKPAGYLYDFNIYTDINKKKT
ncbi:MAG: hypothetical protein ABF741_07905 [Liquorilactobacillus ghanensis]